jgi:hypothetical protein
MYENLIQTNKTQDNEKAPRHPAVVVPKKKPLTRLQLPLTRPLPPSLTRPLLLIRPLLPTPRLPPSNHVFFNMASNR